MAEEEKRNIAIAAPEATTTATEMKSQPADPSQFKSAFDARKQSYDDNATSTLNKSFETQKQGLQNAYEQNMAGQTQATNAGQAAYDTAKQNVYTQAAVTGNDMNRWADRRGLNYQPGSQQALSLGRARAGAAGGIAQQQQMALQESQRQQELLKTDYQNQISKAVAANDYKTAAALLDNYNKQNSWLDQNAAAMASFGNFTGYEYMYGPEQARAMQQFWIGSNPELAYNTGVIDAKRYKQMTGKNAPDVRFNGGGGNDYQWYNPWAVGGMPYGGSAGGSGSDKT